MRRKTYALALGGIVAALCWTLLISTGLFPFMSYAMPAIAGFVLIAVAFENGTRWAYLTYIAVSLLCFIMATDIEAVVLFITIFGYYPTLRIKLQVMRPKWVVVLVKAFIFNVAILADYVVVTYIFGLSYLADELRGLPALLLMGVWLAVNAVLWVYDVAVGNMTRFYIIAVRPKIRAKNFG